MLKGCVFLVLVFVFASNLEVGVQGTDGEIFRETLSQMRQELFMPAGFEPFANDSGRRIIISDRSEIPHKSPIHEPLMRMDDGYLGIAPLFSPQNYIVGSRRQFFASGHYPLFGHWGQLVRQGNHVNIWILDNVHHNRPSEADLNRAIIMYDDITARMTRDFAPFAGVHVMPGFVNMPIIGDVHNDGRVNVLLHNGFDGGYFWSANFFLEGGNVPIAVFHMNPDRLLSGGLFAHELQHLLFYIHFGVYVPFTMSQEFVWFDEALSELAWTYWEEEGAVNVSVWRLIDAVENSYTNHFDTRVGDFLNFNNSFKNYGMSGLYSSFKHRLAEQFGICYAGAVYRFFAQNFPRARNHDEFLQNSYRIYTSGMNEIIGDISHSAGITMGADGELAFQLMYFLFMEAFAADGGIIEGRSPNAFVDSPYSAFNLWGIRPNLGRFMNFGSDWGRYGVTPNGDRFYDLGNARPFSTLHSHFWLNMHGYNGMPPLGASHERFYRIPMHSENMNSEHFPVLNISIDDNSYFTNFYVVIPLDQPGAVSSPSNPRLGQHGARVYPLLNNNEPNFINTSGQDAYFFIVTLYRNVDVQGFYQWLDRIPPIEVPPGNISVLFEPMLSTWEAAEQHYFDELSYRIGEAKDLMAATEIAESGTLISNCTYWARQAAHNALSRAVSTAQGIANRTIFAEGDYIEMVVLIEDNPGFASMDILLNIPQELEVMGFESPWQDGFQMVQNVATGDIFARWDSMNNFTGDGELFFLLLRVKEEIGDGITAPITIEFSNLPLDENFDEVVIYLPCGRSELGAVNELARVRIRRAIYSDAHSYL
ncbi:MAG: hypothetical protein FWF81_11335 [Defluviitaleaceae bacterium]|nr:hypothetical protein [Defluviitaleaceae bacterium]